MSNPTPNSKLAVRNAKLATVPTLPKGNDQAVAKQLTKLVKDASDGLRRIIIAGLFIEQIAAELKHGQLRPWLDAHCPDVTYRTVKRWRDLARNVAETAGVKLDTMSNLDLPKMLALPAGKVPEAAKEVRQKIDDLIAGKSAKQLFFEFKQAEEAETGELKVKAGRMKGQGGATVAQRAAAKLTAEQEAAQAADDDVTALCAHIDELANDAGIGRVSEPVFARLLEALALLENYVKPLAKARAAARKGAAK
jgi:hypothetical protein